MLFFNKEVYTTVIPSSKGMIRYKPEILQLFFSGKPCNFHHVICMLSVFLKLMKTCEFSLKYIILFYSLASIKYFNSIKDCQRLCLTTSKNAWAFHGKERIFLLCL